MPKGSPELTNARREEIMSAAIELYKTNNFKEITIKDISDNISFARSNIYNYFQTKEEIFLTVFENEYRSWVSDLEIIRDKKIKNPDELANELALSLSKRELMLKLLSVNLYDLEDNCRSENLVSFKKVYKKSRDTIEEIFKIHLKKSDDEASVLTLTVFEFLHGVYPYAFATKKQTEAMKKAGIKIKKETIFSLAYAGLKIIL